MSPPRWTPSAASFRSVTDFEREFPSLCFALATGVGKTRLMGAFISYLHLAHGINNFFVLAPNLTIYNKLIADFTPEHAEVRLQGHRRVRDDAAGDHHRRQLRERGLRRSSIELIRCKRQHLQHLEDQHRGARRQVAAHQAAVGVHRRELLRLPGGAAGPRAAHGRVAPLPRRPGVRAINELKPVLGLELTATPFVETAQRCRRRSRT